MVKPSPDHKAILVGVVRRAMIHQNLPLSLSKRICQDVKCPQPWVSTVAQAIVWHPTLILNLGACYGADQPALLKGNQSVVSF